MEHQPSHTSEDAPVDSLNQPADAFVSSVKHYITRLRFQFLTPIAVTLSFAVLGIIALVHFYQNQTIDGDVIELQATTSSLYQNSTQQNAKALQTIMDALKMDPELATALAKLDRKSLLQRTAALYEDMNRHYNVTHFYFTRPDRVNLLRVHKPGKYGDTINRKTTLIAQRSGTDAYGVELGPLGTLTLRYVQPWYDEQTRELIGFVELGMEVDQTVNTIRQLFGLDLFVLIKKEYLDRSGWEDGMRTFGRIADWERFPAVVVSMHGSQVLPDTLSAQIQEMDFSKFTTAYRVQIKQNKQYAIFQPIHDVTGRPVGMMVMLVDTTSLHKQVRDTVLIGTITVIVAAIILILFFYWLVGRIGARMARDEWQLEQMATHDGLTGLFNRRQFDLMLEHAIALQARFKRPISLLMIDIDHFKQVNDTYGHPAGDVVLTKLAELVTSQARKIDRVCRYGGEEFVVLLPETDASAATVFAKRLCDLVANTPVNLDKGKQISLTVSIGVASHPYHADTSRELLTAVDKALYTAKETGRNRVCSYQDPDKTPGELHPND